MIPRSRCHRPHVRCAAFCSSSVVPHRPQSADFVDLRRIGALKGDANAGKEKAAVCSACHGANGISPASMFPNLAGQRAEYLYWQLVEFKREARPESPMTSQVANLDDATLARSRHIVRIAAAASPLTAQATGSDRGARSIATAILRRESPPCQGCHGAAAKDMHGRPTTRAIAHIRSFAPSMPITLRSG